MSGLRRCALWCCLLRLLVHLKNLLMDSDKRTAWEARRKKQEESLEHLRKK